MVDALASSGDEGRGVAAISLGEVPSNLWSGDFRMGKPSVINSQNRGSLLFITHTKIRKPTNLRKTKFRTFVTFRTFVREWRAVASHGVYPLKWNISVSGGK